MTDASNERRERYLSIIKSVVSYDQEEAAAEALMALADAEQNEQRACSCIKKSPADFDGPDEDCPQHGNPAILGYCPLMEWEAWRDENARLRAELEKLRTRAEKAERAADLLAGSHRRAEQAEAALARVQTYAHELRHKDAMGLLACLDAPRPCAECGHPKEQHSEADELVSVGQCQQCVADGNEGDAWHNYETPKGT